jgi:hypothetical protein
MFFWAVASSQPLVVVATMFAPASSRIFLALGRLTR